ncbi:MAG: folate-binding protein YgfZ [Gammaproteobacteria bacterium]|nr:folate-binding protein YgfZ [Gammaproteobacteria bacterium]
MNLSFLSRISSPAAGDNGFSVPAGDEGCVNLSVQGADARNFLQGQVTIDIDRMEPGHAQIGALCTPQGRVSVVFDVLCMPDQFILIVPFGIAKTVMAQLQRYILRSRVVIGPVPAHGTISVRYDPQSDLSPGSHAGTADDFVYNPSWLSAGWRFSQSSDASVTASDQPLISWAQARILWGVSQPVAATQNLFLPQMLNLDRLEAVNYNKGCYTGQEVIARSHFRGTVKRQLYRFVLHSAESNPAIVRLTDTILTADQSAAGTVVECAMDDAGDQALMAVVKNAAADGPLYFGEHPLVPWPLD